MLTQQHLDELQAEFDDQLAEHNRKAREAFTTSLTRARRMLTDFPDDLLPALEVSPLSGWFVTAYWNPLCNRG